MPKQKFVQVTWIDAWEDESNFATAHAIAQTHEPMTVRTRGWLLVDDDTGISLAGEDSAQDGHDVFRRRCFIPRVNVKLVEELKFSKPRKVRNGNLVGSSDGDSAVGRNPGVPVGEGAVQ